MILILPRNCRSPANCMARVHKEIRSGDPKWGHGWSAVLNPCQEGDFPHENCGKIQRFSTRSRGDPYDFAGHHLGGEDLGTVCTVCLVGQEVDDLLHALRGGLRLLGVANLRWRRGTGCTSVFWPAQNHKKSKKEATHNTDDSDRSEINS